MKKFLETGKIVGTHGIKGMTRVQVWADSSDFLSNFKFVYLDSEGTKKLEISSVIPHGTVTLVGFKGVGSIEQAEKLRGSVIYIDRNDFTLPEGRYFIDDLLDCTVTDADSKEVLGVISDITETGANDVWHISNNGKEYLVPAVDEVIVSVNVEEKSVVLRPMKGIFDDED